MMNVTYVSIDELIPADYNPRKMEQKDIEDLKKSLDEFGFVEPVLVNSHPDRKNIIIGGHQRVSVAKMLGFEKVPVVYAELDLEKEKELNIRLNKNHGRWDFDLLANVFEVDDLKDWGFEEFELGIKEGEVEMDNDDLTKTLDSYLDGNIRQVVIYFTKEQYDTVIPRLDAVMNAEGVENHTEAFLAMLENYENTKGKEEGGQF